jgi:PAS domain S-box-containing protein
MLRRAILVPVGTAAIVILLLLAQVRFLDNQTKWVEHTDQVISLAERIYRIRIDQETSFRAYLLTHDVRFLDLFHRSRDHAHALELELHDMIADNPQQQSRNEAAVSANRDWVSWAENVVAQAQAEKNVDNVTVQLQGKELMDRYREARGEFINNEERLREERLAASRRAFRQTTFGVIMLGTLLAAVSSVLERKQLVSLSSAFRSSLDAAKNNAQEAKRQHDWLSTVLRSIGDAVIATDANGIVVFMNPVAEYLTGWTAEEAAGKALAKVFHIVSEETRKAVEDPVEKVLLMDAVVGLANHTILLSKTGQEIAIDDSAAPIRADDSTIAGIVLVFRDVTQQRSLEAALRSNERLALAGRLSASIAHEINNPLDTVVNLLFLLEQETINYPDLHESVARAQREVHRVTQISKNMLSLHRVSRSPTEVDVAELLDGVIALIDETISKGRRKIQIEHGFQGTIKGFPAELRQVFTNVIKNAVEATEEGGEIRVTSRHEAQAGRPGVRVDVTDNGAGISPEMRTRLFTPFVTTKEESGTGLGLWVSRSIVEKHGGTIMLSNQGGHRGTTVTIFLPLDPPSLVSADDSFAA